VNQSHLFRLFSMKGCGTRLRELEWDSEWLWLVDNLYIEINSQDLVELTAKGKEFLTIITNRAAALNLRLERGIPI
jgi:hypothetical protein